MFKISFKKRKAAGILALGILVLLLESCTSSPQAKQSRSGEPLWLRSPDAAYDRNLYIAAVGHGQDRGSAEQGALVALTAHFGQSVQGELKTLTSYSEVVKNKNVDLAESTAIQNAITISAGMNSLVGAEIADVWFDGKSTHYAVAIMERASTVFLYSDMIRSNLRIINGLTALPEGEKNSLEGYSRYQLAAVIADTNQLFSNVLSVVGGGPSVFFPGELKKGEDYRLEALNIVKTIPIVVIVGNDDSGRIKAAFTEALSRAGFRSGGVSAPYVLDGTVSLTSVELPNQTNKFIRYEVNANLRDMGAGGAVLFPYNISGREGHLTITEAENRAVTAAVREITGNYEKALLAALSGTLPMK